MRTCFLMVLLALSACAAPNGADWATADFNKYGHNYAPFPTERLRTGMTRQELAAIFGPRLTPVSNTTYAIDRWASVPGPDYVEERLTMQMNGDRLASWRIEKASAQVSLVPRRF